ncbi:MAG TPA: ATP-binding protein, partial [Archangium sp.]
AALASNPAIAVHCEGLHGAIDADPALIRILVLNLLRNAGKYGGKTFTVRAERDERGLRVRFTDDGPGIPRAEWERVFEPFHRLDANVSGSGLGLALARRIAELHGGTLVIEDSSAHGTTFVLTVPPK